MESPGEGRRLAEMVMGMIYLFIFDVLSYEKLTLLVLVGASRAAAIARLQTVVLAVQVAVQTTVDIQVGITAEQTHSTTSV